MNTKIDKHYTFHNCNVVFNNPYFPSQLLLKADKRFSLVNSVFMFEINVFLRYYAYFFPLKMHNKTIIGFGFCDMQNYQCLGKSYQPRLRLG